MASLRDAHEIPVFDRSAAAPLLTMDAAALELGVSAMTIRRLMARKLLPATQPVAYAPWAIRREDLALEPVQRAVEAVKAEHRLPQPASDLQLTFTNSRT